MYVAAATCIVIYLILKREERLHRSISLSMTFARTNRKHSSPRNIGLTLLTMRKFVRNERTRRMLKVSIHVHTFTAHASQSLVTLFKKARF